MIAGNFLLLSLAVGLGAPVPASAGPDCAGPINQLRAVIDSDAATGNLNRSVYARMQPGLAQAATLCRSGHPAEALRELQAVKHRNGYR